jgi:hypothetical protein
MNTGRGHYLLSVCELRTVTLPGWCSAPGRWAFRPTYWVRDSPAGLDRMADRDLAVCESRRRPGLARLSALAHTLAASDVLVSKGRPEYERWIFGEPCRPAYWHSTPRTGDHLPSCRCPRWPFLRGGCGAYGVDALGAAAARSADAHGTESLDAHRCRPWGCDCCRCAARPRIATGRTLSIVEPR